MVVQLMVPDEVLDNPREVIIWKQLGLCEMPQIPNRGDYVATEDDLSAVVEDVVYEISEGDPVGTVQCVLLYLDRPEDFPANASREKFNAEARALQQNMKRRAKAAV